MKAHSRAMGNAMARLTLHAMVPLSRTIELVCLMAGLAIVPTSQEETMAGTNPTGRNPFVLPPDEEVFRMREADKNQKAQDRITRRGQKVCTTVARTPTGYLVTSFSAARTYNHMDRTAGMQ